MRDGSCQDRKTRSSGSTHEVRWMVRAYVSCQQNIPATRTSRQRKSNESPSYLRDCFEKARRGQTKRVKPTRFGSKTSLLWLRTMRRSRLWLSGFRLAQGQVL